MTNPTTGIAIDWLDRARTAEARVKELEEIHRHLGELALDDHEQLAARVKELEAALRPLAAIAVAIDRDLQWHGRRADCAALWSANARDQSKLDLTMGHARAARRALGAVSDG